MTETTVLGFPHGEDRDTAGLTSLAARILDAVRREIDPASLKGLNRGALARRIKSVVERAAAAGAVLNLLAQRDLVTEIVNTLFVAAPGDAAAPRSVGQRYPDRAAPPAARTQAAPIEAASAPDAAAEARAKSKASVEAAALQVRPTLIERIDPTAAMKLSRKELARQVGEIVIELLREESIQLNQIEQRDLVTTLVNDMMGLGPLEQLLGDETITDIMVNGPKQVYIERGGKLTLTDVTFRDNAHLQAIALRIVTAIGRRIDETSPMVDARLADGSRVNIIIPPLAIDGPSISIRKFAKKKITLDTMARQKKHLGGDGHGLQDRGAVPPEYPDFRRHRVGQDDPAERVQPDDRAG